MVTSGLQRCNCAGFGGEPAGQTLLLSGHTRGLAATTKMSAVAARPAGDHPQDFMVAYGLQQRAFQEFGCCGAAFLRVPSQFTTRADPARSPARQKSDGRL
jgi:hypothetical protein